MACASRKLISEPGIQISVSRATWCFPANRSTSAPMPYISPKLRTVMRVWPDGAVARRIDERGLARAGEGEGVAVGGEERGPIVQRRDLDHLDAEGRDDGARVAVHDLGRRGRELDAVAVHHEHEGRAVLAGGDAAVEHLARHPAGIAAVADDGRAGALARPQAERLARGHGHDGAEAAGAELGAPGHVRARARRCRGCAGRRRRRAARAGSRGPRGPRSSRCSCGRARW